MASFVYGDCSFDVLPRATILSREGKSLVFCCSARQKYTRSTVKDACTAAGLEGKTNHSLRGCCCLATIHLLWRCLLSYTLALAVSFILYPVTIPCTCVNCLRGNMVIVASGGAFDTIVIMIQKHIQCLWVWSHNRVYESGVITDYSGMCLKWLYCGWIDPLTFFSILQKHNKVYKDEQEEAHRYTLWQASKNFVAQHKPEFAAGKYSFTCGMNQFSDLDRDAGEAACGCMKRHQEPSENTN